MKSCYAILVLFIVFVVNLVGCDPITEPQLNDASFPGEADRVHWLPNVTLPFGLNYSSVGHYSGHLVSSIENITMHYWFFRSKADSWQTAPVVLWLGGWVSALNGALNGISPIQMNPNGTLSLNAHSWNRKTNLLFIESFAQVGFLAEDYAFYLMANDTGTSKLTVSLIEKFYEKYPFLSENDLFLSGEGYSSFHITVLAKELVDKQYPPNFKGVIIGNGVFNMSEVVNSHFQYVHTMKINNLYPSAIWDNLTKFCCPQKYCSNDECSFQSCQTFTNERLFKSDVTVYEVVEDNDDDDAAISTSTISTPTVSTSTVSTSTVSTSTISTPTVSTSTVSTSTVSIPTFTAPDYYDATPGPEDYNYDGFIDSYPDNYGTTLNTSPEPSTSTQKPKKLKLRVKPQPEPEPPSDCNQFYLTFYQDLLYRYKYNKLPNDLHNIKEACLPGVKNATCDRYIVTKKMYDWLNAANEPVREALHIQTHFNWIPGNPDNFCLFRRQYPTLHGHLMFLLRRNIRVLLYTGEFDGIVPKYNTQWLLNDLSLTPTKSVNEEWKFENNSAGYRTRFCEGLSRYGINDAGHTVAEDKPAPTLEMIEEFIFDDNLAAAASCPQIDDQGCTKYCSTEPSPAKKDGFCIYWVESLYRYFIKYFD